MNIEKVIREYVTKSPHMSLATVHDNKPWVCEVHFASDENLNLYFVSLPTTRHCQELTANPSVAGNIVRQHGLTEVPHGIYFEGTAEVVAEPTEELIQNYAQVLGRDVEAVKQRVSPEGGHHLYKITVLNWAAFGKFDGDKVQKYELAWSNQ